MDERKTPSRDKHPALSVVIPSYRSHRTLPEVLAAICRETAGLECEVLVLDSTGDGQAARDAAAFCGVTVVEFPRRLSCGAARNAGAAWVSGDWILFLDADCVPVEGWGGHLRVAMRAEAPMQSGAIANGTPSSWAGTLQYWIEFSRFHPASHAGHHSFLPSFQLLIRRELFQSLAPYPEEFLLAEDLVFFTRLTERGHRPVFHPRLVVRHLNRDTFPVVFRHLYGLGAGSGRARAIYPNIPGGFFRRFPFALPLLFPYSWMGLAVRLGRAPAVPFWRKAALLALAVPGLSCWHFGFIVGLLLPRARWFPPAVPAAPEAAPVSAPGEPTP